MKHEIYTPEQNSALAHEVGRLLLAAHCTCTVAESCTGGMIGATLTSVAGASAWFKGGVIAYSNEVKRMLLGVPEETLVRFGAVSAETVKSMAVGAAAAVDADIAVSVSGIAGPDGGSSEKPVGLVYIGLFCKGQSVAYRHMFTGDREAIRSAAVGAALQHLVDGFTT